MACAILRGRGREEAALLSANGTESQAHLVFKNGISPLGLLRCCLDYALNDHTRIGGVFDAIRTRFKVQGGRDLLASVSDINNFRNSQ